MQTQPHPTPQPTTGREPRVQPNLRDAYDPSIDVPSQLARQAAEIHELRGELERLRAERDRLADRQREIAELLRCKNPEKLLHDFRNLLNELQLYKTLAETAGR